MSSGGRLLGVSGATGTSGWAFWIGVIVGGSSWGLGYPGQPHILVRFMALRDPKAMRRAAVIGITWVVLAMAGAMFVGLVGGKAYLDNGLVPGFLLNLVLAYVVSLATGGARPRAESDLVAE